MGARVNRERRAAAVDRLAALRAAGSLSSVHVRLAAEGCGVSEQTVRRWMQPEAEGGPRRTGVLEYRLREADREAFAHFRGNIQAVYRARRAVVDGGGSAAGARVPAFLVAGWAGAPPVSRATLYRAFAREMTIGERAMWREGEDGLRRAQVYMTRPAVGRNVMWEMDHKNLPVLVLPPRGPAVTPWLTTIVDDGTRALVGWAIALTPHAGTILTALRMALAADPARGPFGAVPTGVRIDRGLDFAATAIRDVLAALCVHTLRLPAFTPHRKGKVERLNLTIDQTLLCTLPGYTRGPRTAAGKLYGPLSDAAADRAKAPDEPIGPMRIELFAQRFAAWERWYNTERPHRALNDATPLAAWQADTSALHRIGTDRLRHLLLAGVERTIQKDGIHFRSLAYIAPELHGRGGENVQVRYMPHDDRFIEVYQDGAHLCTAHPQGQLTAQQTEAFRAHARAETKRLSAARRRATKRTRTELVPLTGTDTTASEATVIPARAATALDVRTGEDVLRRRARSNLLGLHEPVALPPPGDTR